MGDTACYFVVGYVVFLQIVRGTSLRSVNKRKET